MKNRLQSLRVQNLLSFGENSPEIPLGDLNVLVGPNGSGKSNLIEVIGLLRATRRDFATKIGDSGGIAEWLWKGKQKGKTVTATISVNVDLAGRKRSLSYVLSFTRSGAQVRIVNERIENDKSDDDSEKSDFYFDFNKGKPLLNVAGKPRFLKSDEINLQQSVLSQRQDPDQYPELTSLGRFFGGFRLHRNWHFGPDSDVRDLYGAGQKNDFLREDSANLGLMLNRLRAEPETKAILLKHLQMFYAGAEDILTPIQGGMIDLRIEEADGITIPALRLSDGTLRWLSLLTILLHPDPPPLICIEEPELGLHPDMIQPLANLLLHASRKMQLIVTTHSTDLIDALSANPDTVLICEKNGGSTTIRRLDAEKLVDWLKSYKLGQLWRTGELGGNRW